MNFEIIDAHVHPFSPDCGVNVARFGHPADTAQFIGELKNCGISKCCGSFVTFSKKMDFKELYKYNEAALKLRDEYPDFYIPGIHIHGDYPEDSIRMLRDLHKENVRWIGELVNYLMPIGPYDSPGMLKICETAAELDYVLNLHVNTPELSQLEHIAAAIPELKIVLAHPGDEDLAKRLELVKRFPNISLDISGTGLFRWGLLRHLADTLGAERILFGSDFPVCSPGMNLHGTLSEHLTEQEFKLIFSENFKRLTGI